MYFANDFKNYTYEWGQCDDTIGVACVLHMANVGSIPGIPYGPLSTARIIPKCRI